MPPNPRTFRLAALGVALATLIVMMATEPRLAIVWDEGYTLGREARLRLWFRALADPIDFARNWTPPSRELVQQEGAPAPHRDQVDTRARLLFDSRVLAWFWPFAREEPHGHPPFYALVGMVGDVLTPKRTDLERARLGPMLGFSLTAGLIFLFMARRWGVWAGSAAAGAWVLQPNLFAHGHYATYDAILAALWVTATLAFARVVGLGSGDLDLERGNRRPRWAWIVVFGLLAGCAADTKLTGWFLPIPLLVWSCLYRSRRGFLALLAGGLIAALILYALNPPWWTDPIGGVTRFIESNLNRARTIPIKVLFLGQVVSTPDGSLPWYNTLLWTIFVTPVGFLTLALLGVGRALRRYRTEPFGILALGQWFFLLVLRALPHTPGHDGVRQFLPAFGMLAVVAGLGAATLVQRFGRWGRWFIAAALAEGALSVVLMMPVPLSYYSPLVGGLRGASALGMEPTYYWDSLSDESLDWLRAHTMPGQKIRFASGPTSLFFLQDQGRLPAGLLPNEPGSWTWYVVQNRPGAFSELDRELIRSGKPAFEVRKWGVPLLWVFPYDQVERYFSSGSGPTERPTTSRIDRRAVGHVLRLLSKEQPGLLSGGVSLARGLGRSLRGSMDNLSRGVGLADDRSGLASSLLVTKADLGHLELLMAATTEVLEHTALRNRNRLANRRRRRARLDHHARGGGRGMTALLLVASRGVGSGKDAEHARQGKGQQVASHGVISLSQMQMLQNHAIYIESRVWAF